MLENKEKVLLFLLYNTYFVNEGKKALTHEKIFNDQFDRGMLQKYFKWKKFNAPKTDSKSNKSSIRERQKIMKRRPSNEK